MRKVNIINLTEHSLYLMDRKSNIIHIFSPSGIVAKCPTKTQVEEIVEIGETGKPVPLTKTTFNPPDLPPPIPYTYYIVSEVVARFFSKDRDDLRIVNGLIKENGKTIGCRSLGRV